MQLLFLLGNVSHHEGQRHEETATRFFMPAFLVPLCLRRNTY